MSGHSSEFNETEQFVGSYPEFFLSVVTGLEKEEVSSYAIIVACLIHESIQIMLRSPRGKVVIALLSCIKGLDLDSVSNTIIGGVLSCLMNGSKHTLPSVAQGVALATR